MQLDTYFPIGKTLVVGEYKVTLLNFNQDYAHVEVNDRYINCKMQVEVNKGVWTVYIGIESYKVILFQIY